MSSIYASELNEKTSNPVASSNGGGAAAYGFDDPDDFGDDDPFGNEPDEDGMFGGFEMEMEDDSSGYIQSFELDRGDDGGKTETVFQKTQRKALSTHRELKKRELYKPIGAVVGVITAIVLTIAFTSSVGGDRQDEVAPVVNVGAPVPHRLR